MTDTAKILYRCPSCSGGPMVASSEGLACQGCGRTWPVKGGIADLGTDIPYYGEMPVEKMRSVVAEAREKGWKKALFDNFYQTDNFLYRIASYETRADWLYLLDLDISHAVLDVGSGWGTEAVPLARNAGRVVAMDGTMERLEFLSVRAMQDGADNITCVRGSILSPPLMDAQFDLVVMNGVLEWVGTADDSSDPLELQKKALSNAFSLIRPGGRLYIGIENSHGCKYLLGEPDDHTGLPGITYLPREEADALMMEKKGTGYRTYTHTRCGYMELLAGAGFGGIEFFYPMPDYKFFKAIAPLGDLGPYRYYMDRLSPGSAPGTLGRKVREMELAALGSGELGERVSSYGIVAVKERDA